MRLLSNISAIQNNQRWTGPKIQQTTNISSISSINQFVISGSANNICFPLVDNKLSEINIAWEKEYNKYSHYIKDNQERVNYLVKQSNQIVAKIHFEDFEIELTPNDSVKYTLLLPDKKFLIITKPFVGYKNRADKEVVFSIFENKKLILSDIKNLDELVTGINKYIAG